MKIFILIPKILDGFGTNYLTIIKSLRATLSAQLCDILGMVKVSNQVQILRKQFLADHENMAGVFFNVASHTSADFHLLTERCAAHNSVEARTGRGDRVPLSPVVQKTYSGPG